MGRIRELFRSPFAMLFARSPREERLAAYIIREHRLGRTLEDILDDPYIKNRSTEEERRRLLDRPEVIRAVGEDTAAAASDRP